MNKLLFSFWISILAISGLSAQPYFEFSPRAQDTYHNVFSLRFEAAREGLNRLKQLEPDNLIGVFLENYLEVLRIGVDDDEHAYKQCSRNMDSRLYQLSRGEPRSPYYRYTQAEVRLQWALLRARFGDYISCLSDVKLAYALLEENERRFPDFVANKKSLGVLHALVGNVPDDYRWALRLLGGMRGSIHQGLAELETVLAYAKNHEFVFETESLMAYGILQSQLNNQREKAWLVLKNSRLSPKANPLAAFALAHLAIRSSRNDAAIKILQESPRNSAYHPFYYCDYLLGIAKLQRLDADANLPLQTYINNFHGQNAVKETYQKLAWHQLLQGNTKGYYSYMSQVKHQGVARSDPDKVALREADAGEMPDSRLLKARLLFDGGYYSRAFDLLKNNAGEYSDSPRNKLEYYYRMGRLAQKMNRLEEANRYFEKTISNGASEPWYFACNAALQLATMHEEQREVKTARWWYRKCLSIKPEEYAGSLHAKAKAGLNRLH